MPKRLQQQVWRRAGDTCEYCRMPQAFYRTPFHIDHVVSKQHGGKTVLGNLALSCFHCNSHKGPNIAGIDPETGALSGLYNPRLQRWDDHFVWRGAVLVGRSPTGRATIYVLAINDPLYVAVREALMHEGSFPVA